MRLHAWILYFAVPAAVYFTLGVGQQGLRFPNVDSIKWFLPNYWVFAAPHIVWAMVVLIFRLSRPVAHIGFASATVALLCLHVAFECCVDNRNALGWMYYWPLSAVLIVTCLGIVAAWKYKLP